MNNILLLGSSSAMAQSYIELLLLNNFSPIAISTKSASNSSIPWFQVDSYQASSLPTLEMPLKGLVYFPGTVNLQSFSRLSIADFTLDLEINLFGAIHAIQKYLHLLKQEENSSITLFSTVAVKAGMPFHSSIATAKGALEGLVRSLAAELAPSIRVNAIAPSITQTPMVSKLLNTEQKLENSAQRHPLKCIGTTQNIAQTLLFLQQNTFVTGQILHVDGGLATLR